MPSAMRRQFRAVFAIAIVSPVGCFGSSEEEYGRASDELMSAPVPYDAPAQPRDDVWISKWDNPPMSGDYKLRKFEKSTATSAGWLNDLFDVVVQFESDDHDFERFASPKPGTYTNEQTFTWIARGTKLPPRVTMAQDEGLVSVYSKRDDSTNGPIVQDSSIAKVQLDPNVILVPLHVVQLYVPGDDNVDNGWYSDSHADVTFDDDWLTYDDIFNSDPMYPFQAGHSWLVAPDTESIMQHQQPDRIWSQCDIQFRVVSYSACPVADDIMYNREHCTESWGCTSHSIASPSAGKIMNAVNGCEAAKNKPGELVIMAGSIDNSDCDCFQEVVGITDPYNWAIVSRIALVQSNGGTLAHELGHLLGIKYDTTDNDDLMYQAHNPNSQLLLDSQDCSHARTGAAAMQDEVWPPAP